MWLGKTDFHDLSNRKITAGREAVGKSADSQVTRDLVSIEGKETKSLQAKLKRCMVFFSSFPPCTPLFVFSTFAPPCTPLFASVFTILYLYYYLIRDRTWFKLKPGILVKIFLPALFWTYLLLPEAMCWCGTSQTVCPIQLQLPSAAVPVTVLSLVLRPEIHIMCSTTAQHFKNKTISGDRENCPELVLHHLEIKQAHLIPQYNSREPKQIICNMTQNK